MTGQWEKISFLNIKNCTTKYLSSHAQLPTALVLDNCVRVFFAGRTQEQRSHIHFVDLVPDGNKISFSGIENHPVLFPGKIGTFDEHGVYPSSIVKHNGQYYMYYIGWNQGVEAPLFYASIGLAISNDGENFEKYSSAPIMARSEFDPCLVTSPHVFIEDNLWRMTYVSGIKWERGDDGKLKSFYHIKYAESDDGINWRRNGHVAIDFQNGETNIARSSVIGNKQDGYKMWFSYVHADIGKYRIGYAHSDDALSWQREDKYAGISIDNEHAKEMICYPHLFCWGDDLYMLYNGDNFGQHGFGVARWVS